VNIVDELHATATALRDSGIPYALDDLTRYLHERISIAK
jgi:hypothetical protein